MTKHTILFLAANPFGTDKHSLDRQARAIQAELERCGYRDRFELVTRWAVEPLDLLRELRKLNPTVVQFSGSGGDGEPALFLQGADGRPQLVSTAALQQTFGAAGSSVKLVVLSACFSEPQAEALLTHVDCVVGMSGSITSHAARSFAVGFYGGLGERESVHSAFLQGCAAISLDAQVGGDQPRLKVRRGVDADRLVLAAEALAGTRAAQSSPSPRVDSALPPPGVAAGSGGSGIDIGILTIRDDEFRAVLGAFPDKAGMHKGRHREYALRHADAGGGQRYTLAILRQIEQGNGEAQSAVRDLIDDLAPRLVLVIGIAGGLPSDDVTLGDVVLSMRIHDFTVSAHKLGETTYAATGGPIASALGGAIANLAAREDEMGDWTAGLPSLPPVTWHNGQLYGPAEWQRELRDKLEQRHGPGSAPRPPRYIAGPIASSDRLVQDPELLFPWITTARDLLAVEMESGGVYRAARERCPMLAIRGISDIVGLRRADAWIKFACASAAAFARAFLRTRPVEPGASAADPAVPTANPAPATGTSRTSGSAPAAPPRPAPAVPVTRNALRDRLSNLVSGQFEDVLFRANIPPQYLPGRDAPQSVRAIDVIRYFESHGRLDRLAQILQDLPDPS